ncbi:SEL1-like repeat protein [Salaquimonas pukyongi]|uniref:SEL1-like repeat protein n=1 Tax=Salaquimonas pukyongi TaxID=2712698 RepID=UPI00096B6EEB|nr:SEL1-like repeat protein [Salaquimonas pukyongi]
MSRIRSHLDAIISGDGNQDQPAGGEPSPRPAFPRSDGRAHAQPAPAQTSYGRPQSAPNLQDIHRSLDQLSRRISAASRSSAPSAPQVTASAPPLAGEIQQEIHRGISQLKQELGHSLDHDLKRIADGVAAIQNGQNLHPDYADRMQAELQNLNNSIRQIAEMQSAPASQVDLSGVSRSIENGYSEIVQKLDQVLAQRGDELPQLPDISVPDYSNEFKALATRIEEVARAVVSMSVSAVDGEEHHALERIEARLASLAKAVEAAPAAIASSPDTSQFADMASHQETVAAELARLSQHLEALQAGGAAYGQPGSSGEPAHNMAGLEERITALADRLDDLVSGAAQSLDRNGDEVLAVLRDLVGRVEAIEQLAVQAAQEDYDGDPAAANGGNDRIAGLESQISAIISQLGSASVDPETGDPQPPLPGSIAERLENIESQIAASRDIVIDMASQAAQQGPEDGANAANLDAVHASQLDEVLAELRQIREASAGGDRGTENLEEIAQAIQTISTRLDQIETVQTWPAAQQENDGSFEGLGAAQVAETPYTPDTLQAAQAAPQEVFSQSELPQVDEVPPLAPEHDQALVGAEPTGAFSEHPAHPADADPIHPADAHPSDAHPSVAMAQAGEVTAPEAEDVPLEPGSGMPDLESLVRRATNRKRAKNEPELEDSSDDDGINDLMAAARRAAQAASAQAHSARERNSMGGEKTSGLERFSSGKPSIFSRKALLASVAVIALAYAGWAIVPKFLGSSSNTEISQITPQERPLSSEEAGEPEIAAVGEDTAETDEIRPADDARTAEAPESAPVEEMPEASIDDEVSATMPALQEGSADTVPAMAAGNARISIPDGMPKELANSDLVQDAANGNGNALFEIARRYTEGDGVDRDLKTAAAWYQKAADLGHAPSQYRLGNFYEKGHGVTADTGKAAQWYSKAAASGNALAMHNLAVLNVQGLLGSDPDMETAIGWFEKAANLGVKDSQVNLGILYTRGMGVKADLEQAYKWFAIAAKGGDNDAAAKRDTVAKNMRPEQLEKARGEAEIWKPKTLNREANTVSLEESWKTGSRLERAALPQTELIRRTQAILTKLGFDPGPADGIMGAKTEEAIRDYQKKFGLPVDGRVSPGLLEALSAQAV